MSDTPEVRELQHQVALGLEAEAFLGSPLGRAIIARLEDERVAAIEELIDADPEYPAAIRAIQARIWRADTVQYWLAEIVTESHNALEQLEARQYD